MVYSEILFQGSYILERKKQEFKDKLIAASFTAWQTVSAQSQKPMEWNKYLKGLGLTDKIKANENELKEEAERALNKVEKLIQKARESE